MARTYSEGSDRLARAINRTCYESAIERTQRHGAPEPFCRWDERGNRLGSDSCPAHALWREPFSIQRLIARWIAEPDVLRETFPWSDPAKIPAQEQRA